MAREKVDNKLNVVIGTKAQVEADNTIPDNSIVIVTDEEYNKDYIRKDSQINKTNEDKRISIDSNGSMWYKSSSLSGHDIKIVTTNTYTILPNDSNKTLIFTSNMPIEITVPTKIVQDVPQGSFFDVIQYGDGKVSFVGTGIVLNSVDGLRSIEGKYIAVSLIKIDNDNEWLLIGGLKE